MVEVLGNRLEAGMEVGMGWSKYLVDAWDGWRERRGGLKRGRGMVDLSAWGEGWRGDGDRSWDGNANGSGSGESGELYPKPDLAIIPKCAHRVRVRVLDGAVYLCTYYFVLSSRWKGIEILNNNI